MEQPFDGHALEQPNLDGLEQKQLEDIYRALRDDEIEAERRRRNTEQYRRRLRREVIDVYGAKYACCGETQREFLTVDHIGGWGGKHRREAGGTYMAWADLRRRGWPKEGIRLLCGSCHVAISYSGACPHEKERQRSQVGP